MMSSLQSWNVFIGARQTLASLTLIGRGKFTISWSIATMREECRVPDGERESSNCEWTLAEDKAFKRNNGHISRCWLKRELAFNHYRMWSWRVFLDSVGGDRGFELRHLQVQQWHLEYVLYDIKRCRIKKMSNGGGAQAWVWLIIFRYRQGRNFCLDLWCVHCP